MERTDTEYVETESVVGVSALRRNLTRYDFVLGVIPLALLSGTVVGAATPLALELVLGVAAICCLPVLFDALYRNPPVPRERTGTDPREREATQRSGTDRVSTEDVDRRTHG